MISCLLLSFDCGGGLEALSARFNVGMEPQIAKLLVGDGIPVLSINSLVYFRVTRTPAGWIVR